MLRNYFTIVIRNIQRRYAYTTINVLGLGIGLAGALLIFSLVAYHLSFDSFHTDTSRIYRFVTEQHRDQVTYRPNVPNPFGKVFRDDYTFGEKVARICTFDDVLITTGDGTAAIKFEDQIAFAEPEFFNIFNYPLKDGAVPVLNEPNTAILTQSMARKYFGDKDPATQTLRIDNRLDVRIAGVLKDLPGNTDRKTGIYISYGTLKQYDTWSASEDSWGGMSSMMQCFVKLRPGVTVAEVEAVLPAYVKKYRPTNKNVHHYKLQPLLDMHFNAHYGGVMEKRNLWVLSVIGIFLIVTACINFVNLATALAVQRAKEVGVRKVLGSPRKQLFWQFIFETGIVTAMAAAVGLILATAVLPYMNEWFNAQARFELLPNGQLLILVSALIVIVTLLAGFYPGLILSGFKPVVALKGKVMHQHSPGGFNTRRSLIVTQFAISQVLTIGLIVIIYQIQYARQSDMGFDKDAVVMMPLGSNDTKMGTLQKVFQTIPGVERVSACFSAPSSENNWRTSLVFDNRTEEEAFFVSFRGGDDQYLATFGIPLVAGRNVQPSDTAREFVVNETFAKKLGLSPEDILGHTMSVDHGDWKGPIVGVVRDFHDFSFHEEINPVFMTTVNDFYNSYGIKINTADVPATLAALTKAWTDAYPEQLCSYQFLDEQIAAFYETEGAMLKLIQIFAGIAIFIGCIGLYGLVSFMAAQKTKEIGIRKVLGSSIRQILWIFGKEFALLILIAFAIAAPLGTWVMNEWLENFKYKIDIELWIYILTVSATTLVAVLTVSYRSLRAAVANPVNSLRSE